MVRRTAVSAPMRHGAAAFHAGRATSTSAASATTATATASSGNDAAGKLHELRQYVIHTDDVPKYLALTGGDAFKPRTEASRLLGFWPVDDCVAL